MGKFQDAGLLFAWQWGGGSPSGMGSQYGASSSGIDRDWIYTVKDDIIVPDKKLYKITIEPVSDGDKKSIETLASSLGINYKTELIL